MEIDAISPRRGNYNTSRTTSGGRREQQRPYRNPQFNQWATPGVPICGHCGKKGHLSKHCFKANRQPKQQVHLMQGTEGSYVVNQPASGQWNAFGGQTSAEGVAPTVSSAGVNYAVVPESQDFVGVVPSGVGEDAKDAIHSLSYLSQNVKYREGSTLKCSINDHQSTCLIDTGATISAISVDLAKRLHLMVDSSQRLCFTTATGTDAWTHGCVDVQVLLGEIPLKLHCDVVEQLAHPIIIGFKDLQAHKAIIDLDLNVIKFPTSSHDIPFGNLAPLSNASGLPASGLSGSGGIPSAVSGSSVIAPKRYLEKPNDCYMVESLKLPCHHHAYCTIRGPRNTLAMVSTPINLAAKSLISVAAGTVQFDNSGLATVKIAHLDIKHKIINKGQRIAIADDNGKPYSGLLVQKLAAHLQVKQRFTPAYHSQSNGLVERFMGTLRNLIVSYMNLQNHQYTWDEQFGEFMFAYNSSVHEAIKVTPFSLVHGREPRSLLSVDFGNSMVSLFEYQQQVKDYLGRAFAIVQLENMHTQAKNAIAYNTHCQKPSFQVGDSVLVYFPVQSNSTMGRSGKLSRCWRGPFLITSILSSDRFDLVELSNMKSWTNVHATRIKRYFAGNADIPASSPPDVVSAGYEYGSHNSDWITQTAPTKNFLDSNIVPSQTTRNFYHK
ncbi:hypothetical protein G6F37_012378 [Rhizopus arrhizus]|nr:hypothetical protein G6F38_012482 [Rhizopus arrhizus]KAG1144002.1 hypothetical protein G6F37_012378 [Rhizopus arrhizus]